jgi:hypothetical protein
MAAFGNGFGRPIHASGLGVLGPIRCEDNDHRASLCPGLYLIISHVEAARKKSWLPVAAATFPLLRIVGNPFSWDG